MATKEKPRELKPVRGEFVPCGRQSSLGGFDPKGNMPGRNPNGSNCENGWRTWWSRTLMGRNGEPIQSDRLELVVAKCRCLKRWESGLAELPGQKGPQPALPDGKTKGGAA